MPKISIITINYNNAFELERTIRSVLYQTFTDYEYIVVDGGSTDASVSVIQKFDQQLTHWVSEPDRGVYHAMNKGIGIATGNYLFFLNSGDVFFDHLVLEKFSSFLKSGKGIFYGNVWDVNESGEKCKREKTLLSKTTIFNKMICHQSIFAKRELFQKNGSFDESYRIKADYEWLLRNLFANESFEYIDLDICLYKMGGMSASAYYTYSVFEIPKIRSKFYSKGSEFVLQRIFANRYSKKLVNFGFRSSLILRLFDTFIVRRRSAALNVYPHDVGKG